MKQVILLVFFLIAISQAVPCGRCLLKGDICQFDNCAQGLKCVRSIGATVDICLESVDRDKFCNNTKDYDACITDFYCNRTSGYCELNPSLRGSYSYKNDGCKSDYYCMGTMTCKSGTCKGDLAEGQCATDSDCTWNQYCDVTDTTCKALPSAGQACVLGRCKFGTTCQNNPQVPAGVCVSYYTVAENQICKSTSECKPGLYCNYNGVCVKPKYSFFLGPQGVSWGGECYPGEAGCSCHSGLKSFHYFRENQKTVTQECVDKVKNFDSCMEKAKCTAVNSHADSCMRKNCWNQYIDASTCDNDPSTVPQRCGAASLIIGFLMMIALLVL